MKPSSLSTFLAVDDLFRRYGAVHTVAIIAKTLTPALGQIIRERGISAQLHCWDHDDLSADSAAIAQLPAAVARIEETVGTRPTTLYPPWNRTSEALKNAAAKLRLKISTRKISLEQYIRFGGDVAEDTVNMHYWHDPDVAQLEQALTIAASRQ